MISCNGIFHKMIHPANVKILVTSLFLCLLMFLFNVYDYWTEQIFVENHLHWLKVWVTYPVMLLMFYFHFAVKGTLRIDRRGQIWSAILLIGGTIVLAFDNIGLTWLF